MTGIGDNQARIYGEYSDIPERFQPAIRAGVNFFELRTEKPIMFDRLVNGPFSVSAREDFNSISQRTEYIVDWQTGDRASIRFEVVNPKTGLAKGFMPDDPYWRNRIYSCDTPDLQNIHAYHTRGGMFPGDMLKEEINLLYEKITVPGVEFTLFNAQGRAAGSFQTRELAERDIRDNNYKNYEIRERVIRVKSPQVLLMIKNWHQIHRSRFGWTDCPEFKELQQEVRRIIKERRTQAPIVQVAAPQLSPEELDSRIVAAIRRMPIEERKKLVQDVTKDQVHENVFAGKPTNEVAIPQLRAKCAELGIKVAPRANRQTLLKALRAKGYEMVDETAAVESAAVASQPAPVEEAEEEIVR